MNYREEAKRLDSFHGWPSRSPVSASALSRAGFFYTGTEQRVQCAFCDIMVEDWTYTDQAIAKHRDRNPSCPFVLNAYTSSVQHDTTPMVNSNRNIYESERYFKESERRKTFVGWPLTFISAEDLARAGFVYLNRSDTVQCVFCLGIVASWERGDVPWAEHQRHFRNCPFIRHQEVGNVSIEDEYRGHVAARTVYAPPAIGEDVTGRMTANYRPERHNATATNKTISSGELNILPHSPAKNPSYKTTESRLRSFGNWPQSIVQAPADLAEAGFFYTGESDQVKCFHCSGGLQNWEPRDNPWEEHARWFPNCEFISLKKGKEYIALAKEHRPPVKPVQPSKEISNRSPSWETPRDVTERELDHLMESEVAERARALNLDETKMRAALRRRMCQAGYPFGDVESLANAVLDLEHGTPEYSEPSSLESEATGGSQETNGKDLTAPLQPPLVMGLKGGCESSAAEPSNVLETLKDDRDPRICKICWDKEVCVVFLPCGHLVSCAECASALGDCPFCRQQIKGTVRTYWS